MRNSFINTKTIFLILFSFLITSCQYSNKLMKDRIKENASQQVTDSLDFKLFCGNGEEDFSKNLISNEKVFDLEEKEGPLKTNRSINIFNSRYELNKDDEGKNYFSIIADKKQSLEGEGGDGGLAIVIDIPDGLLGKTVIYGAWVRAASTNTNYQALGIFDGAGVHYSSNIPKDDSWHWMTVTKTISDNAQELLLYGYAIKGLEGSTTDKLDVKSPQLFLVCS